MGYATTKAEWQARASAFFKAQMKAAKVTCAEVIRRLSAHDSDETKASLTTKFKQGTFAATFAVETLAFLALGGIQLKE